MWKACLPSHTEWRCVGYVPSRKPEMATAIVAAGWATGACVGAGAGADEGEAAGEGDGDADGDGDGDGAADAEGEGVGIAERAVVADPQAASAATKMNAMILTM